MFELNLGGYDFTKVAYIPLTKGFIAYLDIEDFKKIAQHRWTAQLCSNKYYALRKAFGNKSMLMHHEILGKKDGYVIDHINGNTMDYRKINLRFVSRTINALNSSKQLGCYKSKNRYIARVRVFGKDHVLGRFINKKDAIRISEVFRKTIIKQSMSSVEFIKLNAHLFKKGGTNV